MLFHRSLPAALVLAVTATLAAPTLASADSGSDAQFVSDTNAARSQHGLHAYSVASDLTSIANRWAAHMAANRTLEHNPNASGQVCCWQAMGENVGVGGSVSEIQQAFMGSSPHRANILSSTYAEIGVGTARGSDGRLYVDELFRLRYGATAPRATTSTSRPATHTRTYTYAAPRASRSAARAPLRPARIGVVHLSALHPSTLHPSTLHLNPVTRAMHVATFLRQVRQRLPGRVRADAVGGAFGYVQVMNAALGH